jgi:hypothetical protein
MPDPPPLRIGIIGAGISTAELDERAWRVGALVAGAGAVLVCGGRGGVMAAASRGARESGGLVVGFLPGERPDDGNPWLTLPLATGLGEARNLLVVAASEALVVMGGNWGTVSEIAFAGKLGRPTIVLDPPSVGALGLPSADGAEDAVRWALERAGAGRVSSHD